MTTVMGFTTRTSFLFSSTMNTPPRVLDKSIFGAQEVLDHPSILSLGQVLRLVRDCLFSNRC